MFHMTFPAFSFNDLEQRLHFKQLWESGIKGQGVNVAVLDTGFNQNSEIVPAVIYAKDFTGEDSAWDNGYWHGTGVATGIRMIAPEVSICNLKVIPEHVPLTRETVCNAIQFCINEFPKYQVINLSLYFKPENCTKTNPCKLCSVVNEAVQTGIIVVAAAGNLGPEPGTITCPGLAEQALTVVSTWSKKEDDWWNNLRSLKKWWWKDFTGEFGKTYGTSYSAAWASGGAALLKSAFPESGSTEIKEAILTSANSLPNTPETSGTFRCKEALDLILNTNTYDSAMRAVYFNSGNKDVQQTGSYFTHELGLALSFIGYKLISQAQFEKAISELTTLRKWIIPGKLPDYEKRIDETLKLCKTKSSNIN